MEIRDRIKELKRVPVSELVMNDKNWRTHPIAQREALEGVLTDIGYADALIARETVDALGHTRLELVDGHLRAETTPDAVVPVLVLDISEKEADVLLATFDPISAMAGRDELKLKDLLHGIESEHAGLNDLLASLTGEFEPLVEKTDWKEEWEGMPEFVQEDSAPYRTIQLHFRNEEHIRWFSELLGQGVTDKTKSMWYPKLDRENHEDLRYIDDSE